MFSRLANLGISGMLFLGFGVAIIAMIILSVTAWRGFSSIAVNSTAVTEKAQNVNNEMTKVSIDTKQASEDTRLLVETVEKKIMPATRLSVQDMIGLEEVFEEIVETFAQLTEQENLSVDDFIMEAEDILEMIKRENLPLVRSIRGDTEENSKHMQDMVNTLKEFEKNLQSSVAKTLGAAQASSVILEDARNAQQKAGDTKSAMAVTAVIIGFLLIGFSIFIGNAIIGPIKTLTAGMRDISEGEGDLTKRVSLKSKDELGELAHWFNVFVERIQNIMINIAGNSETLASSAAELYATAEQSYKGTEKQSGQVGEVATSMEEMSATISEVAKKSLAVSESAKSASEAATTGGKVVLEAIKGMSRIESSVKESAAIIEELGKSSQQIGEIISVIDDIADQTNLLALNAAIEAARAGEQGRGFAVVADEVRKLAERTTRATKEISVMIQAIQSNTLKAVSSMEGGTKDVSSGVQLINQAGESLENILGMIKDVTTNIEGIATSSEQQSATAEDISKNTAIASEVSTELSTGAEQSSKAAKQVSVLAGQLKEIVEQFKL